MLAKYNEMSAQSRVWVYQSNRVLTNAEVAEIKQAGEAFVTNWTAHENALNAAFEIKYNLFLFIVVDESYNDASGCSIDKSVKFIQEIEHKYGITLMNRMLFAYKLGDGIEVCARDLFEQRYKQGTISDNTIVFNNLIQTKAEAETAWELPLGKSWHKQLV